LLLNLHVNLKELARPFKFHSSTSSQVSESTLGRANDQ
jgi:hypothetical protein